MQVEDDIWTLKAPLRVQQSKKKMFTLNMNIYRNAHFFTLNTAKKNYKAHMESQITKLPYFEKFEVVYLMFPKTRALTDVSNVCSIHDKFFCDALVEFGKAPDDNYNHLRRVIYQFGEIDKHNPRVEIYIKMLKGKSNESS